jgi:MerR family transcriptional regulator, thiopeptide resistance regulator
MPQHTYRIREFAQLAGVTIRALHHYDRLGLLRPRRTSAGYRLYESTDLNVLAQIVALKFIGLPLDRIKPLLRTNAADLSTALRAQADLLDQKKRLLERAIEAVRAAHATLQTRGTVDHTVFKHIIEVIEMQNNNEQWNQQYETLVQGKIERLKAMTPEVKARLQKQWVDLFKDIEGALDEDPTSPGVQALADRWVTLLQTFVPEGAVLDPQVLKAYGATYQPSDEPPAGAWRPQGMFADRRIWDFMQRALVARA